MSWEGVCEGRAAYLKARLRVTIVLKALLRGPSLTWTWLKSCELSCAIVYSSAATLHMALVHGLLFEVLVLRNATRRPFVDAPRCASFVVVTVFPLTLAPHRTPACTLSIHAASKHPCQASSTRSGISTPSLPPPTATDQPIVVSVPLSDPPPTLPLSRASLILSLLRASRTPTNRIGLHLPGPSPSIYVSRL